MSNHKKNRNIGAAVFFIIFSLLFFVLIVRFVTIQSSGEVKGKVLAAEAEKLHLREGVLKAKRGSIFDQNGQVIAEDSESYTLVAVLDKSLTTDKKKPRHVVDPAETAKKLAEYIDMKESEIYSRLTKDAKQVEFGKAGRDLSHSVKNKIEALKLPGIGFLVDTKRFYPNGVFASHLIGYAQKEQEKNKPAQIVGKMGLEQSFNDLLTGKDGSIQYEGDAWNYILPNAKKHIKEPQNGQDIYLTIDKKIQTFLEDAMSQVDEKYSPEKIMAVVADPKTGKILAMGQRPTFHPETREGIDQTWHNEVVETSFEPGSTMKVFSLAAAMEKGVFDPNDTFPSGQYRVDRTSPPIKDHNGGAGWGTISYLEGVQRSSNVGFAYLLEKMGTKTWLESMNNFKFGQKTNIGLPNEATGKILYRYPVEKVTSVYGQGTTVTALQMVQAMTAIANNGVMMKPYIVDKIVDPNEETVQKTKPEVAGKPISKETAREVIDVLETVVTGEDGTGKAYNIEGYQVAGKTGTAQIAGPSGYLEGEDNYIFSFLGLAPAENPQLIMYVMVEKPKLDGDSGTKPVSMIFNTVMKSSLQYLNIKPEEFVKAKTVQLPDFSSMGSKEAVKWGKEKKLEPVLVGKGEKVINQSPLPDETLMIGEKVFIKTEGSLTLPNMTGWSKREVMNLAEMADIQLKAEGEGYLYHQSYKPGTVVKPGDTVVVQFQTPQEALSKKKDE
ncbi:penicillin-binding protein [Lederbergia sp. NSJ-179]|uniref:penicillin-binding protein n=1 Tax=Lederbergia sp. NSJ-179 TaxID=2931402 RepID=UPI001FD356A4|nr:penicillin-binding protein [Lederbergia sp. NSJ-179]MCJ7839547.1 penicillin-binding protein [Lederbergia sp. NSJ-179]